jgi:hypothetical protein
MAFIKDVQFGPEHVSDDATEQTVYSFTLQANTVSGVSLYRLMLAGSVSSRAVLPGTITLRYKCAGLSASIVAETLLPGVTLSNFVANLDCWVVPGSPNVVVLGGIFSQNAADVFPIAGARSAGTGGVIDLSVDQIVSATIQFDTADPGTVFTRQVCALMMMDGTNG